MVSISMASEAALSVRGGDELILGPANKEMKIVKSEGIFQTHAGKIF